MDTKGGAKQTPSPGKIHKEENEVKKNPGQWTLHNSSKCGIIVPEQGIREEGYNEQKKAVDDEVEAREAVKKPVRGTNIINRGNSKAPARKKQSTSGTFSGDVDVSDDF